MAKKETFPKIAQEARLKKVIMSDTCNVLFYDLQLAPEQYSQLERWRKNRATIRIRIDLRLFLEQVQGETFGG